MLPIEVQKMTPAAAASALRAREGQSQSGEAAGASAKASPKPVQSGVTVELGAEIGASEPPVDTGRVEQIRKALRDGTYPIVPTEIADALIAARLMLGYGR